MIDFGQRFLKVDRIRILLHSSGRSGFCCCGGNAFVDLDQRLDQVGRQEGFVDDVVESGRYDIAACRHKKGTFAGDTLFERPEDLFAVQRVVDNEQIVFASGHFVKGCGDTQIVFRFLRAQRHQFLDYRVVVKKQNSHNLYGPFSLALVLPKAKWYDCN
ncbi:hypothetical protein SDC9_209023 [bioreactor metagenome]|uniref:Uncharacterized protein n=1 Tax=bioreactor metagenome TaxID=1076179 RepID=A0A645JC71_9ZZZZ